MGVARRWPLSRTSILIFGMAFSGVSAALTVNGKDELISAYSTDPAKPDQYLSFSTPIPIEQVPARSAILKYDKTNLHQTMEGFGAALTDSSVIAINKLAPFARMQLLRKLFDRD